MLYFVCCILYVVFGILFFLCLSGAPRGVRKYKFNTYKDERALQPNLPFRLKPVWHTVPETGLCEAQMRQCCKLHQLSFVTLTVSANHSDMLKSDIMREATAKCTLLDTRSKMMLRVAPR